MTYSEQLEDPRWQKKRLEVLQRDQFTCKQCGSDKKQLHVHHRYYCSGRFPWQYPMAAYLTLCKDCHASSKRNESDRYEDEGPTPIEMFLCAMLEEERALRKYSIKETSADKLILALKRIKKDEPGHLEWAYLGEIAYFVIDSMDNGRFADRVDQPRDLDCLSASTG